MSSILVVCVGLNQTCDQEQEVVVIEGGDIILVLAAAQ